MNARGNLLRGRGIAVARIRPRRLECDVELHLPHPQGRGRNQRPEQVLDTGLRLQPLVDYHGLAEDALELVDVAEQRWSVLLLDIEQEILIACVPYQ